MAARTIQNDPSCAPPNRERPAVEDARFGVPRSVVSGGSCRSPFTGAGTKMLSAVFQIGQSVFVSGGTADDDPELELRAVNGDADAMRALGGRVYETDRGLAQTWWRRAAELGDRLSMYYLWLVLQAEEPEEARSWLGKAAELEDRVAMSVLGDLLEDEDPEEAEGWWSRAAQAYLNGPAVSRAEILPMYNLGVTYRERDPALAIRLFEAVVDAGERRGDKEIVRDALHNLGGMFLEPDSKRAVAYLTRAAELGDTGAMIRLGVFADDHGDEATASGWFKRAVEAGDGWSAHQLAAMTYQKDPIEARRLLELAAERGNTASKASLGKLLFKHDRMVALRWIEEAAQEGDPWAAGMAAGLFSRRHPMSQSRFSRHHTELMRLLRRAAQLGDPYSMYWYGHRLAAEGDDDQAAIWMSRAAEADIEPAQHTLKAFGYDGPATDVRFHASPHDWVRFLGSIVRYERRTRSK